MDFSNQGDQPAEKDRAFIAQVAQRIRKCVDLGITSFDLADLYGGRLGPKQHLCERVFGWALRSVDIPRDRLQLISKCDIVIPDDVHKVKHYDTSAAYIERRVQESLAAIFGAGAGASGAYLDVLLIHRPDHLLDCEEACCERIFIVLEVDI